MKFKLKAIVTAIGLAAVSSGASAVTLTNAGTGSDLFLTVWNTAGTIGYVRDLGVTAASWRQGVAPGTQTFSSSGDGGLFNTLFGASPVGTSLRWNVVGGNSIAAPDGPAGSNYLLVTFAGTVGQYNSQVALTNGGVNNLLTNGTIGIDTLLTGLNTSSGAQSGNAWNVTASLFPLADANTWGTNWGGTFGAGATSATTLSGNALGTALKLFDIETSGNSTDALANALTYNPGTFTLSANGNLTWTNTVSAVPLPPAVWLLGSALSGIGVIGRRKKQTA